MKQSNNEKGEFVILSPPEHGFKETSLMIEWINSKAKEGFFFSGSLPCAWGSAYAVFWKPEK